MTRDGGTSPPRPESSPDVDLFGATTSGRRNRPAWRIELTGMDGDQSTQQWRATTVRVTLVDAETGKRLGAARIPFEWLRDAVYGSPIVVTIHEGDYA